MGLLSRVYHSPCPKDKIILVEAPSIVLMEFDELIAFIEATYTFLQKYGSDELKKLGVSASRECSFRKKLGEGENVNSLECDSEYLRRGLYQLDTPDFVFQLGVWPYGEATRIWINQRTKNDKGLGDKLVFEFYGEKYLSGEDFLEFHFSFGNEDIALGTIGYSSYLEVYLPHINDKVVFKEFKNGNGQYVIESKSKEECQMPVGVKISTCDATLKSVTPALFSCTTYSGSSVALDEFKSKTTTFKKVWDDVSAELKKSSSLGLKQKIRNG